MTTREVVVRNRLGLHARAAAKFVHAATRYRARILVRLKQRITAGGNEGKGSDLKRRPGPHRETDAIQADRIGRVRVVEFEPIITTRQRIREPLVQPQ